MLGHPALGLVSILISSDNVCSSSLRLLSGAGWEFCAWDTL